MLNHSETAESTLLETAHSQVELGRKALQRGDRETAWNSLFDVLNLLSTCVQDEERDALFASTALQLCELGFVMGKGFSDLALFLGQALEAGRRLGDRRSQALIKLHLARLYYLGERRHDAMSLFAEGKAEVEELGDEDILIRSAEFIGLYFFMQGLFEEAIVYFERALQSFEAFHSNVIVNASAPIWLGYSSAYLGQFHKAIGILDYYRRFSSQKGDRSLAATIRAALGAVLLFLKRKEEATYHLSGALQDALEVKNALATYFARGGLAYLHCLEGRLDESRDLVIQTVTDGAAAGIVRQYASPMALEILFEIHRAGKAPLPGVSFPRELLRILNEPNILLRGVALRLRAMDRLGRGDDVRHVLKDLRASEEYLERARTPIELAKTRVAIVRIMLNRGEHEPARHLAQKAWMLLSGYGEGFYPDDLRHLLEVRDATLIRTDAHEEFLKRFINIAQALVPSADLDRILMRTVEATNRFFGAERGGIFWFRRQDGGKDPVLRAANNLTLGDVVSGEFQANLTVIRKTYQENEPQIVRLEHSDKYPYPGKAIIAIPFQVEGKTRGVLYHDNSYLEGSFTFLDRAVLIQMAHYLSTYIGQIHEFCLRAEKRARERTIQLEPRENPEILARSRVMETILSQADQIAASESKVLILGETGVGKELLANRIHMMSPRREQPFVVVDLTTVPENLVESELFGHEKGAFTGADRQKKGRMELAHGGTLFIDEVGEMPKSIQVKLLRVLQERTLVRIGGNQTVHSDFRLIAATNRDLAQEVADGRFREDLFYRLNVVPITLPPLRERVEDVSFLAQHFLRRYAAKYNRPNLRLTSEDEALLQEYHWPGNVRELQNVIERAVILSDGKKLALDLPPRKRSSPGHPFADFPTLEEIQRRYIRYVLAQTNGQIAGEKGAAKVLGLKRSSLYSRMEKLGLR